MYIYQSFEEVFSIKNAVLAIGTFDGMHLAHRYLVEKVCQEAKAIGGSSVIVSFNLHPQKTLANDKTREILTTKEEKMEIFNEIGVEHLIILDFSPRISNMSYIDFIHFLRTEIDIRKIILGYDHHFGKNREGCYETLLPFLEKLNFEVERIEKQTIDGINISSSSIRNAILCGDVETANKLLGYTYSFRIYIVKEEEMNNPIYFYEPHKILPKNGRYIIKVKKEGTNLYLVAKKPTVFTIDMICGESGVYRVEFFKLENLHNP